MVHERFINFIRFAWSHANDSRPCTVMLHVMDPESSEVQVGRIFGHVAARKEQRWNTFGGLVKIVSRIDPRIDKDNEERNRYDNIQKLCNEFLYQGLKLKIYKLLFTENAEVDDADEQEIIYSPADPYGFGP